MNLLRQKIGNLCVLRFRAFRLLTYRSLRYDPSELVTVDSARITHDYLQAIHHPRLTI